MIRLFSRAGFAFVAMLGLAIPVGAQDTSLQKVPADAAFYLSTMRLGEQLDIFIKSNAFVRLKELPAVKLALGHVAKEMHKPEAQKVMDFLHAPENADLRALIHDLWKHEMFVYAGEDSIRFLQFANELNNSVNGVEAMLKNIQAGISGEDSSKAQLKHVLNAIKNSKDMVVPDVVIGFRLDKADAGKSQVKRLETLLQNRMSRKPQLKDRIKSFAEGDAQGFTVHIDGSLVPWDKVNEKLEDLEDEKGEFNAAIEKLKAMQVTFAVVVKGDYLLISVGSGTQQLARFGSGSALMSREEFAPLKKFAEQRLTSVSYVALRLTSALATSPEDIHAMVKQLKAALDESPLSEGLRGKIGKDLEELGKDIASTLPNPGAYMGFEFLTPHGTEGFSYFYGPGATDSKPLTVLDQVGGKPLFMAAGRCGDIATSYKRAVHWITKFYGHGLEAAEEMAPPGSAEMVKGQMEMVMPFLQKFDELTGTMLFPALSNGQAAFVLDAKWQSSHWMPMLDQGNSSLPLPEIGFVHSLNDSETFIKALKGYRELVNEVLGKARDFGAEIPEEGMPAAQTRKLTGGTMYFWPLPDEGQDKQIQPNFAVSNKFVVASLSEAHSDRLLKSTPIAGFDLKRLAGDRPIHAAVTVDFAGIVSTARLWILKMAVPAALAEMRDDANAPPGLRKADIPEQVGTVLDVISALKYFAAVSYRDGNATVTHYETVLQDVK